MAYLVSYPSLDDLYSPSGDRLMVPDIEVPGVGLTVQPSVAGGTAINDVIGDGVTVQPSVSGGAAWQVAEAVGTGVTVKPSITLGSVSASVAPTVFVEITDSAFGIAISAEDAIPVSIVDSQFDITIEVVEEEE